MKSLDNLSQLRRNGSKGSSFLAERYWEQRQHFRHAPAFWEFKDKSCITRSGRRRAAHEPDKDGRCCFCDWLDPRSR